MGYAAKKQTLKSIAQSGILYVPRRIQQGSGSLHLVHPQRQPLSGPNGRSGRLFTAKTVLKLDKIWVPGEKELSKIRDFSMEVREGEIVGVAGIDGNGQTELIEAITGLRKVERGAIYLKGEKIQNCSP